MPSTSKKQHNFMAAVAKNPAFAKKVGIKPSVGEDFLQADKGKKFGSGGNVRADIQKINRAKTNHGNMALFSKGGDTMANTMKFDDDREPGSSGGSKGDRTGAPGGDDMVGAYKRGGTVHKDVKMDKSMMQKAVNKHEGRLHKGQPMTKLASGGSASSRADGCATKGKTKGTMIKMMGGGAC